MQFNKDGSLAVAKVTITKETEYLWVLKAIQDIPFPVGKKLLSDFIRGDESNSSIIGCKLDTKTCFGCLAYTESEIDALIGKLLLAGCVALVPSKKNKYWKVLEITKKGFEELQNPTLNQPKNELPKETATISDAEKKVFIAFDHILSQYNDLQKKAIITNTEKILCIAGAGSGKTTVLTKRIEFLIRYKSVDPKKILAITFTRKARQEMKSRLQNAGIDSVQIHTFNSFCEQLLQRHASLLYDKPMRVITYKDKIKLIHRALLTLGLTLDAAINVYFTPSQRRGKTREQLINIFRADCFFIRDYIKFNTNKNLSPEALSKLTFSHKKSIELVLNIVSFLDAEMITEGIRDFADQVHDALRLFEKYPETIPQFEHIAIDEYQDVNESQVHIVDILNPQNLFCVGDPRQSIYGWRGSDISYILDFKKKYTAAEVLYLTKNYRSSEQVVAIGNEIIKPMGFPDLQHHNTFKKDVHIKNFKKEMQEFSFIVDTICSSSIPRSEIFILTRTNKVLNKISDFLSSRKIPHTVKSEETNNRDGDIVDESKVVVSTVHAIKGLEAEMVFVVSTNTKNFPCMTSEHPVIDYITNDTYDKEEEERRLLYVALTRAKKTLYVTYTGNLSYFVTPKIVDLTKDSVKKSYFEEGFSNTTATSSSFKTTPNTASNDALHERLTNWRLDISKKTGLPAFMIMHNTTLDAIVRNKPLTLKDLEKIPGLGPLKIQKYGDSILSVMY